MDVIVTDARIEGSPLVEQDAPLDGRPDTPRTLLRGAAGMVSWQADDHDVECRVRILKISGAGASLLADDAPRVGHPIRLSLPSDPAGEAPIEGHVVETWSDPSGTRVIQVRFPRWVPLGPFIRARRERRLWERRPVRESDASLSWREGEAEVYIRGELLNISVGGAAFISDTLPPSGVPIRLRLEAGVRQGMRIDAVAGRVVWSSLDTTGRRVAHIEFAGLCPPEFFDLAVNGHR